MKKNLQVSLIFGLIWLLDVAGALAVVADDAKFADDKNAADNFSEISTKADLAKAIQENTHILLFFGSTSAQDCPECRHAWVTTRDVSRGGVKNVRLYTTTSTQLCDTFSVTSFPWLVYVRNGHPVAYDGDFSGDDIVDEITEWIHAKTPICMPTLNDETFEHLTQASTGATTGDWLVMFYNKDCDQNMAALEAVCYSVKYRMNVACVDTEESPQTMARLSVKGCPSLIFFKQGKMYRYDVNDYRLASLDSFITSWYKNVKAELIPLLPSPFDKLVENIAQTLKRHMNGPNRPIVIAVFVVATVVSVTMVVFVLRMSSPKHKHSD